MASRHEHGMLPCCCRCRVDVCMMGFVCLGRKDMTAFHCRVVHKHNQFVIMLTCSGDTSELFVGRGLMGQGRLGRCWRRRCDEVSALQHNQFVIVSTCSGDTSQLFVGRGLVGQGRLGTIGVGGGDAMEL